MKCKLSGYKSLHVCICETMLHNSDNGFKTASKINMLTHWKAEEINKLGVRMLIQPFFPR